MRKIVECSRAAAFNALPIFEFALRRKRPRAARPLALPGPGWFFSSGSGVVTEQDEGFNRGTLVSALGLSGGSELCGVRDRADVMLFSPLWLLPPRDHPELACRLADPRTCTTLSVFAGARQLSARCSGDPARQVAKNCPISLSLVPPTSQRLGSYPRQL
jgi:hypothetical protein